MIFRLREIWFILPSFIIGLTVHEFAHALCADLLGDRYARSRGRLSLNPLAHLSPLGTLFILFLGFGWARPVPVNIYNLRNPRRDFLITSLAGPASNILLMFLFVGIFRLVPPRNETAALILFFGAYANGILAFINLLPVPPLDGSRIWPFLFRGANMSGGRFSWVWIVLLVVGIRLDLLNGLFDLVLRGVVLLAGIG